jgi:hypothetical protein
MAGGTVLADHSLVPLVFCALNQAPDISLIKKGGVFRVSHAGKCGTALV